MHSNPALGVLLHAIGGLAAASFYIPYKRVQKWSWELYWILGGIFSWVLMPWIIALSVGTDTMKILSSAPQSSIIWSYVFGCLWGIGGMTFGLSMRYLGVSLGYAMALGFCALFGTIVPPIFQGEFAGLIAKPSGMVLMLGMVVCLLGVGISGLAGMRKEREVSETDKKSTIKEFSFVKGVWVAIFAGVMSACMAFAIQAGKPMAELAKEMGTPELWVNSVSYIVIFAGGFTVNLIACVYLLLKNKSWQELSPKNSAPNLINLLFSALAGITWYLQFMFYGMGTTQMGRYDFSSWTIHMAFIIVFSTLWGILYKEWKGCSKKTFNTLLAGIYVLVGSTVLVGIGNYIDKFTKVGK